MDLDEKRSSAELECDKNGNEKLPKRMEREMPPSVVGAAHGGGPVPAARRRAPWEVRVI